MGKTRRKKFFLGSSERISRNRARDTIFFRWQFLLLTVNTQTNYVQYFFMNTLSYQVDIY